MTFVGLGWKPRKPFCFVSWYKYLIVGLVFSRLGFWSGNLFLIAPFPDLCLLVPFYCAMHAYNGIMEMVDIAIASWNQESAKLKQH